MSTLKMSWDREGGRLVCRWSESEECDWTRCRPIGRNRGHSSSFTEAVWPGQSQWVRDVIPVLKARKNPDSVALSAPRMMSVSCHTRS
jgi:hypothetical protein